MFFSSHLFLPSNFVSVGTVALKRLLPNVDWTRLWTPPCWGPGPHGGGTALQPKCELDGPCGPRSGLGQMFQATPVSHIPHSHSAVLWWMSAADIVDWQRGRSETWGKSVGTGATWMILLCYILFLWPRSVRRWSETPRASRHWS